MLNLKYLDLGARSLWPQWRALFTKHGLREDLGAGLTVACIAIPLSLAIALASGVDPAVGLITAIVGSIVCALFGGTPLAVTGPAAAMSVLIFSIVKSHGLGGLLVVGLACGILQVVFGVLGWGKIVRFVPTPVVAGFTAGIGAVILMGQLPRALGVPVPQDSVHLLQHLGAHIAHISPASVFLTALTMAVIFVLPKFLPKAPATLIAVALATGVAVISGMSVETIGQIPDTLPMPKLPELPTEGWGPLLLSALSVFALASLETLLSSTAVDKIARGQRHDPNQELIGQGMGNVASSLFGGIPVTGVIARSALNVQSGAKTRRAAIFHAIALILAVYFAAPLMARIPIASLAGVLFTVSLRMISVKEFREILKVSKPEALVYVFTFFTIVAVDLLVGIQMGIIAAILIAAVRAGQTHVDVHEVEAGKSMRIYLNGSLSFLASSGLECIRSSIEKGKNNGYKSFVLDLSDVWRIDVTGAEELINIVRETVSDKGAVVLQGVRPACKMTLAKADHGGILKGRIAVTESQVQTALYGFEQSQAIDRLVYGIKQFRKKKLNRYHELLEQLAEGQAPHTLFLTCSDSRINPNLLTSTDLGELFVMRNVGNAVPPFASKDTASEKAALEFAIQVLGIRQIVICGHTGCGAMKAICSHADPKRHSDLDRFLRSPAFEGLREAADQDADRAAQLNILNQGANLLSFPFIEELVEAGDLRIDLWLYDLKRADIDVWNMHTGRFEPIDENSPPLRSEIRRPPAHPAEAQL